MHVNEPNNYSWCIKGEKRVEKYDKNGDKFNIFTYATWMGIENYKICTGSTNAIIIKLFKLFSSIIFDLLIKNKNIFILN